MAWQDELIEAAYTSPETNTRFVFQYENVSRSFDKKTTGYEFPDVNGTYVQDLGRTGRRYPLQMFFSGDDYLLAAEAFEQALGERGIGLLEHPVYGAVNVVPFGEVGRRDDLVTAGNQAAIRVTFWETTGAIYPSAAGDPATDALTAIDEYNAAMAEELANSLDLNTVLKRNTFIDKVLALVDTVSEGLQAAADTLEAVQKEFDAIVDSINSGIDLLVGAPLALAFQVTQMIQAPGRALAAIRDKLDAYGNLASSLIGGDVPGSSGQSPASVGDVNELRTNDLFASSYVTGSAVSAINTEFVTKTDALAAAEEIINQFDAVVEWRDQNFQALADANPNATGIGSIGQTDTGVAYQKLQETVALTAGFLIQASFSLKQERRLVLIRPRTPIDLCAELYGAVDSELDFFITSNDLSGSEILEIPAGRQVLYYI